MGGLRKLIRSTAFRLAAFYLLIFGVSSAGLLGLVYWRSAGFTAQQIDETIAAELQGLNERYRLLGIPGLRQVVAERSGKQSQSLVHADEPGRAPARRQYQRLADGECDAGRLDGFRIRPGGFRQDGAAPRPRPQDRYRGRVPPAGRPGCAAAG